MPVELLRERHSIELKPHEVSVKINGNSVDLAECERVFIYRGWPKGPQAGPAQEYLELHCGNQTTATYRLSNQRAIKVDILP